MKNQSTEIYEKAQIRPHYSQTTEYKANIRNGFLMFAALDVLSFLVGMIVGYFLHS